MLPESDSPAQRVERVFQLSLLLLAATGYLAIIASGQLDAVSVTAVAAALVYRLLSVAGVARRAVPKLVVSALAVAVTVFYVAEIYDLGPGRAESFMPATIRLMALFTGVKLLAAEKGRDYFYLGLLAFLQLLTASLFLFDVTYLGVLILFLLLATAAYSSFEIKRGLERQVRIVEDANARRRNQLGRRLVALSAALAAGIVTLSAVLFFLLPRLSGRNSYPPWADYSVGFAQDVDLGATGVVRPDHTPVMRIESLSGDRLDGLRWRGLALWQFNGRRWSNPSGEERLVDRTMRFPHFSETQARSDEGQRIRYAVSLEPLPAGNLFLAGVPEEIRVPVPALFVNDTGAFLVKGQRSKSLRYEVQSWAPVRSAPAPGITAEVFPQQFAERYLSLPDIDPRIPELAAQLTRGRREPFDKAEAIEHYLRTEFGYTIDLPLQRRPDPLAYFLFERRQGHCEYFASAMVVMLRTLGIPARMAAGFAGGVFNPISGLQVVRSSDAHTWVEAYFPRQGWALFDPTPSAPDELSGNWYGPYWMYWDAIRSSWSEWIVDYDRAHQLLLASTVREASRQTAWSLFWSLERAVAWVESMWRRASVTIADPADVNSRSRWVLLPLLLLIPIVLVGAWFWLRPRLVLAYRARRLETGAGSADDCSFLYQRVMRVLQRRGFRKEKWQTAEEFLAAIQPPEINRLVNEITAVYNAARFGRDGDAERRLPGLVQALERRR